MKNYLQSELQRNHEHKHVYDRLLKRAVANCRVETGHHITLHIEGEEDGNEVPSADTVLFDHDFMKAVFGDGYRMVIMDLALEPAEGRENLLDRHLDQLEDRENAEKLTSVG